jgi:hypothetical protein
VRLSGELKLPKRSASVRETPAAKVHGPRSPPKFLCDAMRQSLPVHPNSRECAEMVAPGITGRTRPTKVKKQASQQKRKRDDVDVEKLDEAVTALVGTPSTFSLW